MLATRRMEKELSACAELFRERAGRWPRHIGELAAARIIKYAPLSPMDMGESPAGPGRVP